MTFISPNKKNLIISHSDFDGIVSAGLLYQFIIVNFEIASSDLDITLINYNQFERFKNNKFENKNIFVLDFPYHPQARFWIDHYQTSFQIRKPKLGKYFIFDKDALSCTELLGNWLKTNYLNYYNDYFLPQMELVEYSNLIDSALYKSPNKVYDFNDYFIALNQLMVNAKDDSIKNTVLKHICSFEVNKFFETKLFLDKYQELLKSFDNVKRNINLLVKVDNNIAIVDYINNNFPFFRYISYLTEHDIEYTLTLSTKYDKYHLGLGYNPWKDESTLNIGQFLESYGGGGRYNVGAVIVNTKPEIEILVKEILLKLKSILKNFHNN